MGRHHVELRLHVFVQISRLGVEMNVKVRGQNSRQVVSIDLPRNVDRTLLTRRLVCYRSPYSPELSAKIDEIDRYWLMADFVCLSAV